jgi:branched-chain amino acid aminotransferase
MSPARAARKSADYVWLNGQIEPWDEATIHVSTVGATGHFNVFEGIKAHVSADGHDLNVFCLDQHLRRLDESMKITRMARRYTPRDIHRAVVELLRANGTREDTYVRPIAFYSGFEQPDFSTQGDAEPEILIWTRPFVTRLGTDRGMSVQVSSWTRITDNQMPPRVKTMSNYQNNRLAALEARANGYDTAVQLGPDGKLAEGPGACVFVFRDGVAITPPVTAGILESVTRTVVMRLLREQLEVPVIERPIDRTELYIADEALFCGTGWEVLPITSVDRLPLGDGRMGPITTRVDDLYLKALRGALPRYHEWLTSVWAAVRA